MVRVQQQEHIRVRAVGGGDELGFIQRRREARSANSGKDGLPRRDVARPTECHRPSPRSSVI